MSLVATPVQATTPALKIELKNVKHSEFASQGTDCFEASVYIDGVKAGTAENSGRGGCNMYYPRDLEDKLQAYAKTLPQMSLGESFGNQMVDQDADLLIGKLLNDYLNTKREKRLCANKVLFRVPGQSYAEGQYSVFKAVFTPALRRQMVQKFGEKTEFLNDKFI